MIARINLLSISIAGLLTGITTFAMDRNKTPDSSQPLLPLTAETARGVAVKILAKTMPAHEWAIIDERTLERKFGWVFFYTTKKHLETRNPRDMVPGNGPLIVEKNTGDHLFLPTVLPPPKAIEEYEKAWEKNQP